jgi:hypothetical protein
MDTWLAWVLLLGLGFTYLHAQAGHLTAQVKAAHAKHVDAELDPAIAALRRLRNQADGDTHTSRSTPTCRKSSARSCSTRTVT